ncbi:unnamed protein product, partial [Phaeothamnion confervicola]
MANGRLYVTLPLPGGDGLPANMFGQQHPDTNETNYLTLNARALLFKEDDGRLRTVCVQLGGPLFPLYTADDLAPRCWNIARAHVRHTVALVSLIGHLVTMHFVPSAFVIATGRRLAVTHPVARFLAPFVHPVQAIDA